MSFTAKDVQALRQSTGAGMMDAKKALEANDGDMEAAKQWLREKGLAQSAKRDDRDNNQGVVTLLIKGNVGAIVQLKCETDFVASSEAFVNEANALAELVISKSEAAVAERNAQLEDMKITLKEKIELGQVVRFEAAAGNLLESYTHIQGGRGVNAVLLETITRNEGKPEAAVGKIVEGRIQGYFKDIVLLEQPYAKDDKKAIKDLLGSAKVIRWSQVTIG